MDTKAFNERNFDKSRTVCEGIEREDEERSARKEWEDDATRIDDSDILAMLQPRQLTDREREILDMWPKFEDGEYVWFGDRYEDWDGLKKEVAAVQFERDERSLLDRDGFHTCFSFGERVKRTAPKDSWEQLEEDARNSICGYFGKGVSECDGCPANAIAANSDEFECCERTVKLDIIRRAKALAGVEK